MENDEVTFGGMTFDTYNVDRDPSGAIGMALADTRFMEMFPKFPDFIEPVGGNLEKVVRIALKRFPEIEPGERIGVSEIKARLSQLRKAGYEVKPYSQMGAKEAWNYLSQVRADVREKARHVCPKVLREIDENNRESREYAGMHL